MPITATGIGSGLDVESLVSQLILADVQPAENRLEHQRGTYHAQLTAYGSVKSALAKFQAAAASASAASQYTGKLASTSSSDAVTATAESSAAVGDYELSVIPRQGAIACFRALSPRQPRPLARVRLPSVWERFAMIRVPVPSPALPKKRTQAPFRWSSIAVIIR